MTFEELPEFLRDLKFQLKRYGSLREDLAVVQRVLEVAPDERPPFSFRLQGVGSDTGIIKVRKIACRALKGKGVNSGLRLIYAYFPDEPRIIFIELYHKSDKEMEDRDRINQHFK